ncbi:MAG: M48 family metallopeptidase, partial [Methylovulum sp.]|nr:M48 family metallopeptidase [Methylovulum sp.]
TRSQVMQLTHQHGAKRQLLPRSVIIKTQKSRWGSCGIHNDININWLLIMAPPEVLEYVVVHELCHIQVRNHSAQFWALVAEHLPDYQSPRQWLKQQGGDLMGYGLTLAGRD